VIWLVHYRAPDGEPVGVWGERVTPSDPYRIYYRPEVAGALQQEERAAYQMRRRREHDWEEWVDYLEQATPFYLSWERLEVPDEFTPRQVMDHLLSLR